MERPVTFRESNPIPILFSGIFLLYIMFPIISGATT
jgi:hypothetical protein